MSQAWRVRLAERAEEDLLGITVWTLENFGAQQAEVYAETLSLAIEALLDGPEILGVLALFGLGQFLEGFFLTPRLVGERIGLHPVGVLFALLFFGKLFGFFGVLLALPISAVSLVLLQYGWSRYTQSSWYQK